MSEPMARTCRCPHIATGTGFVRSGWSADCPFHRNGDSVSHFTAHVYPGSNIPNAIATGWNDPCGAAMRPHMQRTLQELAAGGPADAEYQRLRAIEKAAREYIACNDEIARDGLAGAQWNGPLMVRQKAAIEALRKTLESKA